MVVLLRQGHFSDCVPHCAHGAHDGERLGVAFDTAYEARASRCRTARPRRIFPTARSKRHPRHRVVVFDKAIRGITPASLPTAGSLSRLASTQTFTPWATARTKDQRTRRPDEQTQAIVIYTEPGGRMEVELAEWVRANDARLPIVAFIGRPLHRPDARVSFGHAGAIVEGREDTAAEKIARLGSAGIVVADEISQIPGLVRQGLGVTA